MLVFREQNSGNNCATEVGSKPYEIVAKLKYTGTT